jgi:cobalt/nickel transport system permease protein
MFMHIPDGYLSPSTCAVLYAGATPFWVIALKRVRRVLSARLVPLLSLVAAFSFVVMMFNLPLPGGTTGHAVGMGVATIVLGPWASIIAISVALLIQAINVSALCEAIEFGIQPALFQDASGTPLYAPYPLHIAVPAMLIGHLTFAGLAECVISAGIIAYLQRANPLLLEATSGLDENANGWRMTRPLWIGLAALMIFTPLGLLAAGTAWGEWGVADFKDPKAREQMAAASRNIAPPAEAPKGLEQLSAVWTAPMPDYAPPFLKSKELGYIMSAMLGTGLIILAVVLVDALLRLRSHHLKGSLMF